MSDFADTIEWHNIGPGLLPGLIEYYIDSEWRVYTQLLVSLGSNETINTSNLKS